MTNRLRRLGPPPPVRIAHLGLGAFHRAHQAWWTGAVSDWGIAAFAGRRPQLAQALSDQGGLYSLIVRDNGGDRVELVRAIAQAVTAEEVGKWHAVVSDPATGLITLTVTEAAYRRDRAGGLDRDAPDVAADLAALRAGRTDRLVTVPARLVAGLDARRRADAGPLAIVPCDNLPDNGDATRRVVMDAAEATGAGLAAWVADHVSFVSTVVDRITPATTDADRRTVAELTGLDDAVPVVTEPWREWVLAGAFPAGRPQWENAGARLVDDVAPWAARKLRLLNGGHSLLAYYGMARGHSTVADAVADPACRAWLQRWWTEAAETLPSVILPADDYCTGLLARFANHRIAHRLAQIALDGSEKLPVRVGPVLAERRRRHLEAPAGLVALASWVVWLRSPAGRDDPASALVNGDDRRSAENVITAVAPTLRDDGAIILQLTRYITTLPEKSDSP